MKAAIPTVHLNGSAGSVLQAQNEAALKGVEAAIELLAAAAPHGRDYYVQEKGAYEAAALQFAARMTSLGNIRDELREIVRGVRKQNEARNSKRS